MFIHNSNDIVIGYFELTTTGSVDVEKCLRWLISPPTHWLILNIVCSFLDSLPPWNLLSHPDYSPIQPTEYSHPIMDKKIGSNSRPTVCEIAVYYTVTLLHCGGMCEWHYLHTCFFIVFFSTPVSCRAVHSSAFLACVPTCSTYHSVGGNVWGAFQHPITYLLCIGTSGGRLPQKLADYVQRWISPRK